MGLNGGLTGTPFLIAELLWLALFVVGAIAMRWIFHHLDYDVLILFPVVVLAFSGTAFIFPLLKRWWK